MKALLHHGGPAGHWGNLGLWSSDDRYAPACAALARVVGQAAGLGPGQRVLSVACGAGDELLLWVQAFGVQQALGWDRDAQALQQARQVIAAAGLAGRCSVQAQPPGPADEAFDAVLCVDAAYHLSPRTAWLADAQGRLRPGGRLAFTDLVLDRDASLPLRAAARLCGVPADDLVDVEQRLQQLRTAGFDDVQVQRLDAAVLDGFAAFVRRQSRQLGLQALQPAWWPAAITAALIGPCRAAGLGYALFSARRPPA